MQDRPDAAELLGAVAEYLATRAADAVPREERFQVLVAANLCAVVAREIQAGEAPSRADRELFGELLGERGGDEADSEAEARRLAGELARRLRAGELDDRLEELAERLREHVARKLAVARPGYDS